MWFQILKILLLTLTWTLRLRVRLGPAIPLRETGLPVETTQFDLQVGLEDGRALAQEYGPVLPDAVGCSKEQVLYDGGM